MSEQTANLCTTDACESLRARLAKYEDAEGRPVVQLSAEAYQQAATCLYVLREIGSMDAEDISGDDIDLRFEDGEGRDTGCDVSIVEYAERSAVAIEGLLACLESQAREIERLKEGQSILILARDDHKRQAEEYRKIWAESVAKAQPSGVVLPELLKAAIMRADDVLHALSGWESSSVKLEQRHGAGWLKEIDAIRRELHTQLARLNSSPVSAGEYGDAYQGAREDLAIWKRRALEAESKIREQDQIIENLGNALNDENGPTFMGEPVIRAGVVDERAAFEAWYLGHFYMGDKQCGLEWLSTEPCGGYRHQHPAEQWKVWQARAALTASAPSHSEQVRDRASPWTSDQLARAWYLADYGPGNDMAPGYAISFARELAAMLAAAPSAGSQGGDV